MFIKVYDGDTSRASLNSNYNKKQGWQSINVERGGGGVFLTLGKYVLCILAIEKKCAGVRIVQLVEESIM